MRPRSISPNGSRRAARSTTAPTATTPWGTYLTCEENWAGYFRRIAATDDPKRTAKELDGVRPLRRRRHGPRALGNRDARHARQHLTAAGTPRSSARPRTAATTIATWRTRTAGSSRSIRSRRLRRRASAQRWAASRHEGAQLGPVRPGEPLVWYMGDDSRNEYIYKFVSNKAWDPRDASGGLRGRRQVPGRRQAVRRAVPARRLGPVARADASASTASRPAIPLMRSRTRRTCSSTRVSPPTWPARPRWIVPSGPQCIRATARSISR